MSLNYLSLFESWEIALAKKIINSFLMKSEGLRKEGSEDLLQECMTHWFYCRTEYEGRNKASQKTFMAKVIKNKIIQIIRQTKSEKRKATYVSISLNEPVGDDSNNSTFMDLIPDDQDSGFNSSLKVDLTRALQKLTPQQKLICQLIGEHGLNANEIGKRLNRHHSSVYEAISRIKAVFEENGLSDYLD